MKLYCGKVRENIKLEILLQTVGKKGETGWKETG